MSTQDKTSKKGILVALISGLFALAIAILQFFPQFWNWCCSPEPTFTKVVQMEDGVRFADDRLRLIVSRMKFEEKNYVHEFEARVDSISGAEPFRPDKFTIWKNKGREFDFAGKTYFIYVDDVELDGERVTAAEISFGVR